MYKGSDGQNHGNNKIKLPMAKRRACESQPLAGEKA